MALSSEKKNRRVPYEPKGRSSAASAVAAKALPRCNLCFITGTEMQSIMHAYLSSLPLAEIGDALPAEDFYLKAS